MVHALESIYSLLIPGGRLVDLHPVGWPPPVKIRSGEKTRLIGHLQEEGGFIDYQRADEALAAAVASRLFRWERQGQFDHTIVADNVLDMLSYLETRWKRAIVDSDLVATMEEGMASAGQGGGLLISQTIRIGRLRPLV